MEYYALQMDTGSLEPHVGLFGDVGGSVGGVLSPLIPNLMSIVAGPAVLGLLAISIAIVALTGGTLGSTAANIAHNPFVQHGAGTASADGANLVTDGIAGAAEAINNLHIPGVYIPVQRP